MDDAGSGRCPECGREARDRSVPPPPSLFHWRRLIWLAIPLAIVGFIFWLKHGETTRRVMSGTMLPMLVEPAVDIDLLGEIAYGEREFSLAEAVERASRRTLPHASTPGTARLEVGFVIPEGRLSTSRTIGWPTSWRSRSETRYILDAAARDRLQPAVTDASLPPLGRHEFPSQFPRIPPRERWSFAEWGTLLYRPPPEETGGVYVTDYYRIRGMLASAGFVLLAWWAAGVGVFVVNRFRRREARRPHHRMRLVLAALAVCGVLIAGWFSSERYEYMNVQSQAMLQPRGPGLGAPPSPWHGFLPPAGDMITTERLQRLSQTPGGNAELAQRILEAFDESDFIVPRNRYLSARFHPEASMNSRTVMWSEKFPLLTRYEAHYERDPAFDGPDHVAFEPTGLSMSWGTWGMAIIFAPHDPAQPVVQWMLSLELLGTALTSLALLWLIVWLVACIVPLAIVRRRLRRGRCGGCGYILAPGSAPSVRGRTV